MRALITVLLLSLSVNLEACLEPVKTRMAVESFPDEVTAVREMSRRFLRTSVHQDVEFFGAVLQENHGEYRATFGKGCPGVDRINFSIGLKAGEKLSAFWHTHGRNGLDRNLFSAQDATTVLNYQIPFYLIDPAGLIRVLDPDNATPNFATKSIRSSRQRLSDRAYPGLVVSDGEGNTSR